MTDEEWEEIFRRHPVSDEVYSPELGEPDPMDLLDYVCACLSPAAWMLQVTIGAYWTGKRITRER